DRTARPSESESAEFRREGPARPGGRGVDALRRPGQGPRGASTSRDGRSSRAVPDRERMTVHFTEDHEAFRASMRSLFAREIVPNFDAWERAGIFPAHDLFRALGDAGVFGLEYDASVGGQGADHSYSVILGEELGRMLCPAIAMAISVQTDMSTPSLYRFGSD